MFKYIELQNLGPFSHFEWRNLGRVNVLVGTNDTGKSFLLKTLYSVAKADEEYVKTSKGGPPVSWSDCLAEKIRWVFVPDEFELGKLVLRGKDRLVVTVEHDGGLVQFGFSRSASKGLKEIQYAGLFSPQSIYSIMYFPPKEVLTLRNAIRLTREEFDLGDFDDTYYDLVKALDREVGRGSRSALLEDAMQELQDYIHGEFLFEKDSIHYKRGNSRFGMQQTAEGVKKIGMLYRLLQNRNIGKDSIVFFDELEVNLHPHAIRMLVKILFRLAREGVQVFIATHDYFVLKQCEICAKNSNVGASICSLTRASGGEVSASFGDLSKGIIDNDIVTESLELIKESL